MKNFAKSRAMIKLFEDIELNSNFGEVEKCAIFVHYSIKDLKRIKAMKNRLINFCKHTLKTNNYETFIEIDSFFGERKVFNDMLKRFENGEFSHLLVTNIGQLYKLTYDVKKTYDLANKIKNLNVTTICVDEEHYIEVNNNKIDYERYSNTGYEK